MAGEIKTVLHETETNRYEVSTFGESGRIWSGLTKWSKGDEGEFNVIEGVTSGGIVSLFRETVRVSAKGKQEQHQKAIMKAKDLLAKAGILAV